MRLNTLAIHRLGMEKMHIKQHIKTLKASSKRILKQEETKQANISLQLKFLNPKHMLARGYSLSLLDGKIIKEGNLPLANQVITTLTAQHEIKSVVKEIEPRKNQGNA